MTDAELGDRVLRAIIMGSLVRGECTSCGPEGGLLFTWAPNTLDQLGALVRDLARISL
ncbi:MAG: hypothetical protein GY719_08035 [bacterium]|nr:hypothetical protein [bacterium]